MRREWIVCTAESMTSDCEESCPFDITDMSRALGVERMTDSVRITE